MGKNRFGFSTLGLGKKQNKIAPRFEKRNSISRRRPGSGPRPIGLELTNVNLCDQLFVAWRCSSSSVRLTLSRWSPLASVFSLQKQPILRLNNYRQDIFLSLKIGRFCKLKPGAWGWPTRGRAVVADIPPSESRSPVEDPGYI